MENEIFKEGQPVLGVENTVLITGRAYAHTQEAYDELRKKLVKTGYTIPDHAKPKDGEAKKDDEFFSLEGINFAECGSCESTISRLGVAMHNHQCECCGDPTFLKYVKDGAIRFKFMHDIDDDGREYIGGDMTFRIFEYREVEKGDWNELIVHASPILDDYANEEKQIYMRKGWLNVSTEGEAQDILERAAGHNLYKRSTVVDQDTGDDIAVLILKDHKSGLLQRGSVFNTSEIAGEQRNYKDIKIWQGKKYEGFMAGLPIPETIHLSSKYIGREKHSLAEPNIHETIMRAAGQVSRADYYYQDGRPAFGEVVFERMNNFVKHSVDVPFEEWEQFLESLGKRVARGQISHYSKIDGPGFIYALADWASKMSDGQRKHVKDEPNIGNALVGISKVAAGQALTDAEAVAMVEGSYTDEADNFAKGLQDRMREQDAGKSKERKWRNNAKKRDWNNLNGGPQ